MRYHRRVVGASWSTDEARWTVEVERTDSGGRERLTCGFLWGTTGYYRYDQGYRPSSPARPPSAGPSSTRSTGPTTWSGGGSASW